MIITASAKINLGLQVGKLRNDGYHELETILQRVSLSDFLILRPKPSPGCHFVCSAPELGGRDNLVCRVARRLEQIAGESLPGVTVILYKNIPYGSGLGGGSSDAAAALKGLNGFWKLGLTSRELAQLGADLGSDIPYCLRGGTAFAEGRGERIKPLPDLPFFWVVLALPMGFRLSTASVYGLLVNNKSIKRSLEPLRGAISQGDRNGILNWMRLEQVNSLQQPVLTRYPQLGLLPERMKELGLIPVMSGSGPTFFALTESYSLSYKAAQALQREGHRAVLCWTVP